jgi:hypothetical protein
MHTLVILRAARLRIDLGGFSARECLCSRDKGLKGPHPPEEIWCPLCAVEASQIAGRFPPDCYGIALVELAKESCNRSFGMTEWIERDDALMQWFEKATKEDVLAMFDNAIRRVAGQ